MPKISIFNATTGVVEEIEVDDVEVVVDVEAYKEKKVKEIAEICEATISANFVSQTVLSSTGKSHSYFCNKEDRDMMESKMNILFNVPSVTHQYWKTVDSGIVSHTRDEFISLCLEIAQSVEMNKFKSITLREQIRSATTAEQIDSIVW